MIFSGVLIFGGAEVLAGPIAITASGSYTQNFDSLPTSGSSNAWSNDVTLAGWWAEQSSNTTSVNVPVTVIRAGDGGANSGALYSFGSTSSTNRSLGSLASATPGNFVYGVQFQNSTPAGQNLVLGTLQFTGEQWRNGGNTSTQTLSLWYQVSASAITNQLGATNDTGWTLLTSFNFNTPQNTATASALDGKASTNRTSLSGSLSAITLPRGQYLFLRWKDTNDSGSDHGVAIDDLSLSWTVEGGSTAAPVITSALTGTAEAGVSGFSYQITAQNSPTSYAATGLPTGLSIDTVSGLISGTPDKNAPGTYFVQISASNGIGTGSETLTLTLQPNAGAPVVTATTFYATTGQPFSATIPITGTATSFTATGLPSWASLNTSTGAITGTPSSAATVAVTIRAANAAGTSLPQTLTLSSGAAPALSQLSGSLYAGVSNSLKIFASGTPTSYGATGLPGGLSLDTATGTISGTPAAAGTNSFSLSAVNTYGTASGTFELTVLSSAQQAALPLNVVVNEYVNANAAAGDNDQIELLVLGTGSAGSTADLRGMILKDFANSLVDDTGGKFEFSQNSLWSAVRAGTLIVLSVGSTQAEDTDPADFLLRINLGNGTYFTSRGGTLDLGATDMVIIKAAGTGILGVAGGIHALATAASTPAQWTAFSGKKLKATETVGTNQGVAANNSSSTVGDYSSGTATGALTSFTLGAANNSANQTLITQLRQTAPTITSALTASATTGQAFSYTITSSGDAATYAASPLPSGLSLSGAVISGNLSATAGTYNITLTASNANGSDSKTLVLTVNASGPSQNQTITFDAPANRTYGDAPFSLSASASSGLPVLFTSANTNVAVVTNGTVTIRGAGSTTLTASQAGDSTYRPATPVPQTLTVNPKTLTVTGLSASNKVYDGSPILALTGTPNLVGLVGGDSVTVSGGVGTTADAAVGTNRPVTVSGLTLVGSAAGNYALQNPSGVTVTITPRPLTVRANAAGKIVGEVDPPLTYSVSGLVETNGISGALSRASGANSGVYAIQQGTLTASANYTLTYLSNSFTITQPYLPPGGYYSNAAGKSGTNLKTALNGIIKTGFRSIPYGTGSSTGINGIVPVMKLLFEDPGNTNNLILIYGGDSFPKANFGATGSGVWNREHSWPQSFGAGTGYAESDLFHMYPVRGNVNSDRNNDVYGYVTNDNGADTAPACRELEGVMWEPPDNEKGAIARGILYMAVRYEGGSGDGGTADLELIDGASDGTSGIQRFGQLTDLLAWNRNFPPTEKERWKNNEIYTKYQFNRNPFIDNPDYAEMVFRGIPSVSVALAQNAAESGLVAGKITLKRHGSTSNSLSVNFTWGGSATPGTDTQSLPSSATFTAGADTVEVTVNPLSDREIEATEVLTLTLASSANYVASQNSATLQIADAPVATGRTDQTIAFPLITGTPTYGDATIILGATASSGLTVTYTSSNTNVVAVSGNQITIQGAGMVTLTADQAGNGSYNPALPVQQTLMVERKSLTVTGMVAQNKVYDGSAAAVVNGSPILSGVLAEDSVFLGAAAAVFDSRDVGSNKVVATGYTLSGPDADHYQVVQPSGLTAAITPAGLTVTGASVQAKAFDGTAVATLLGGTLVGVLGEGEETDVVNLAANPTGTFASSGAGTWSVTANFVLEGADAGNYSLTQPAGLTGTITDANPLAGWASSYGLIGTNAAAGADPDGDGWANLAEYALAGNPTNSAGGLGPTVSTTNSGGTNWLRFAFRARTNDGVLVIQPGFKSSLTETNWVTNGVVQKVSGVAVGDGVYEDQVWQTPMGLETKKFLKLNISR